MTCEEMEPLLHGLFDGELDAVHAAQAEAHLAACPACLTTINVAASRCPACTETLNAGWSNAS